MQVIAGMTRWKEFKMKKVSIVIPVYNAEKYVKRTIDAQLSISRASVPGA